MFWIILLLILLAAMTAITLYAYHVAFYASPQHREETFSIPGESQHDEIMHRLMDEFRAVPFEAITTTSFDGLTLSGKYYHTTEGVPIHIQCHGYRGSGLRDFCGGTKLARMAGHNALVMDNRGHGKSDGHVITFGILECWDVLQWVNYVNQNFGADTPIFLSGISMGAATVLMTSALDLPPNVVGIIADCPYTSPEDIIYRVCAQRGFPPKLTMPFIRLAAKLLGHFDLRERSAVSAVEAATIPILLIHGEDDSFVPCDMSREIYRACASPKTLVTFPGAGHGTSYLADGKRYEEAVAKFMEDCLQKK